MAESRPYVSQHLNKFTSVSSRKLTKREREKKRLNGAHTQTHRERKKKDVSDSIGPLKTGAEESNYLFQAYLLGRKPKAAPRHFAVMIIISPQGDAHAPSETNLFAT